MKIDTDELATRLAENCPEIVFALLHGSAAHGSAGPRSDVDLALYLNRPPSFDLYQRVSAVVEQLVPHAEPDIGVLNDADVVYRFEALKGKLLFARNPETYASFYSLTCRQYEHQMASYQRQHLYRAASGER